MGRNLIFTLGVFTVGLGAFDLYFGLSQTGMGEAAFTSIAQSFMLLFPGSVCVAYALQHKPQLTAKLIAPELDLAAEAAGISMPSGDNVVVAFPQRRSSKFGNKSGWSHNK